MGVMKLYSVKDVVVGHFMNPAQFNNDNECIRAVKVALNSVNDLSMKCEDLQMWYLGKFDTETGVITSELKLVCNLIDLVNPEVYQAIKKPILKGDYAEALGVKEMKEKIKEVNLNGNEGSE